MITSQIQLKSGKTDSIKRKHPWIFSGAIKMVYGQPNDGDIVEVTDNKGIFLCLGHFQSHGSIAVRILSFDRVNIDTEFYENKLKIAYNYRKALAYTDENSKIGNAYRLAYGEADSLPGLIIDYYNGVIVIQSHSAGFDNDKDLIVEGLLSIYGKSCKAVVFKSKLNANDSAEVLHGQISDNHIITEYGSQFIVDVLYGQKTGFFIDQRENRKILSKYAKAKNVLNMFCYSGGFSVAALKGEANLVISVDASEKAIKLAEENLKLNSYDPQVHKCIVSDAYQYLENTDIQFDIIILDPPAYAKHLDAKHRAVKGYQRLNALALSKVKKGGFVFTYSCSQVVDKKLFESVIMSAAIICGRNVRVVSEFTHAPCHAYTITHPEGNYLKGLLLYVD